MVVVKNQADTQKINRSVDILNTPILINSVNQRHSTSSLDDHYLFSLTNNNTQQLQSNSSLVVETAQLNVEEQCEHEVKQINTQIILGCANESIISNNMSYLNSLNISPSPSSSSTSSSSNNNQTKIQQLETNKQERNNSISSNNGSDDLDDLIINKDRSLKQDDFDNVIITDDEDEDIIDSNRLKNSSKSNIIEEEEEEENEIKENDDNLTPTIFKSSFNNNNQSNFKMSHNRSSSNPFSIACEVASLSSMTSNYSQFDFIHNRHLSPSPPPPPPPPSTPKSSTSTTTAKSSNSLTSFFFSNSLFNKKTRTITNNKDSDTQLNNITKTTTTTNNNSTLDLIASKLLNLKPSSSQSKLNFSSNSSSSASSSVQPQADTQSIKSNHSAHNLCLNGTDLKITSSCLIFENRPSNLPAKSQQEALKHKQEYEKMVEIAKKKGKK